MVRALLNGAFANTSFCIFDPEGEERISRSGRSPSSLAKSRGRRRGTDDDDKIIQEMNNIAVKYALKGESENSVLEDFNTFRQALNVASADQRLLVFVNANKADRVEAETNLQEAFDDDEILGKFHLDLLNEESDKAWFKKIKGATDDSEIVIIHAGTFGLEGVVMGKLALSDSAEKIKETMQVANVKFASLEDRKTYGTHVQSGRRKGVYFENEIPYGEDINGDGEIDRQRRRGK